MKKTISLLAAGVVSAASTAGAQSAFDVGVRIAPQYHSYEFKSPVDTKITEFALPVFVLVPVTPRLTFDIGTSFTQAEVSSTRGSAAKSTISGVTDTQIRANYTLGNDFVVFTAGVNLPTGQSTVKPDELAAASLIGNDFLALPISNMGTGFGGTGGIAFARPVGAWSVGAGVSVRHSASYDPVDMGGLANVRYQPGNEYRIRAGVDRGFGTGRFNLGLTYSAFQDDDLGGSAYNTGNRWLAQAGLNNNFGPGMLTFSAWNLYRESGHLFDSTVVGKENIVDGALAYGIQLGSSGVIEPNVESRVWTQTGGAPSSIINTVGLRAQFPLVSGLAAIPSVGYSFGRFGSGATGATTTADLVGMHATLAIRVR